MPHDISMADSYDSYPRIEEAFQARLDESLNPSGPDTLFELLDDAVQGETVTRVVDVGCGEGEDAVELAQRLGCSVVGVDPVERHLELGSAEASRANATAQVTFVGGVAESLPLEDGSVDLVFAKESLMYADLPRAAAECARVLRPAGLVFVYQVFTGEQMSDGEAAGFWQVNAGARSVRPEDMEQAFAGAGLALEQRVDLGSQWGEYGQEKSGTPGRRLVHAARLRRDPERYRAEFGDVAYQIMLHDCLWHVYRMLGKLHAAVLVFRAPSTS